jgi:uncharacterized glyoxalase superfamily protein PhnB
MRFMLLMIPKGYENATPGAMPDAKAVEGMMKYNESLQKAGAVIVKPGQETFWGGYAGYFQDPDNHLWEIVWNPQLLPKD